MGGRPGAPSPSPRRKASLGGPRHAVAPRAHKAAWRHFPEAHSFCRRHRWPRPSALPGSVAGPALCRPGPWLSFLLRPRGILAPRKQDRRCRQGRVRRLACFGNGVSAGIIG